jgi:hypothetical protein
MSLKSIKITQLVCSVVDPDRGRIRIFFPSSDPELVQLIPIRTRDLDLTFLLRNLLKFSSFPFKIIQFVFDYIHVSLHILKML